MTVRYLPITLDLRAPAVLNTPGGDPNSAATLDYIPGAAIRGAVAARIGDPDRNADVRSAFQTFVLDGSVRYLHAYPADDGGRRTLPAPSSLRSFKYPAPNRAEEHLDLAAFDGQDEDTWPEDALSAVRWPYISLISAQPAGVSPPVGSRIHHQRDRQRGRAWKEHGALFGYEYLEAHQLFVGQIQVRGCDEAECDRRARHLHELLADRIRLGRSRRAGYGGEVVLKWDGSQQRETTGEGVICHDVEAGNTFRILLTSACLARHPRTGQLDPTALPELVLERLRKRANVIRVRWGFDVVGGFNRKWRLEVPQAKAVAAGSVLLLEANQRIPIADLLDLEHDGIGERLAEGFGRFLLLEPPVQQVRVRSLAQAPITKPSAPASELVHFIERRILQSALEQEIQIAALRLAGGATHVPTGSLLGRLRAPLRAQPSSALKTLVMWLAGGDQALKTPAQKQLERCRLEVNGHLSLRMWITDLASEGRWDHLQPCLRLPALAQRNHVISERNALGQLQQLCDESAVRLIDATLAALAKRRKAMEVGRSEPVH